MSHYLLATASAPNSTLVSPIFLRTTLPVTPNTGLIAFSSTPEQRSKELQRLAFVTAELARAGAAVIAAPIAPQKSSRDAIKDTVLHTAGAGGNFFTVHVATPIEHCEAADRKGVYARARSGELKGVAGVDEVYEAPERADLTVDVTSQSIPEIVHSTYPIYFSLEQDTNERRCRYRSFARGRGTTIKSPNLLRNSSCPSWVVANPSVLQGYFAY